jgi:hypothetical protein
MKRRLIYAATTLIVVVHTALAQVPKQVRIPRTEDPVAPSAPAAAPAPVELTIRVERVSKDSPSITGICRAGLNDEIWLTARNIQPWLDEINKKARLANLSTHEIRDLVPFFNGSPMPGVHPNYVTYDGEQTKLRFKLVRNKESEEAWARLWRNPTFERRLGVSLGLLNGEEMPTLIVEDTTEPNYQFALIIVRKVRFWLGMSIVVIAFVIFVWLARKTEIIRDCSGSKRPDNNWPYSLARAQMAFWFFLVIASFFFLWTVIGSMNTLTSSILALIGISAGTALGAALIDATKPIGAEKMRKVAAVDLSKPRPAILAELDRLMANERTRLKDVEAKRAEIAKKDLAALDKNQAEMAEIAETIKELESQRGYFSYPAWRGVVNDLLGENDVITFHRFQMFVWTLLLGIIFVIHVYNDLAMPNFDATLLGLLGISAGTYVGFKLPQERPTIPNVSIVK